MKYLIGIDIGTTGTKSALFDTEGRLIADAYLESKLYYPKPGWVEQNPRDFYTSSCDTIREVIRKSGVDPKEVAALSLDGQMAGILGIDEKWNAVTHYDSWLDTRCKKYVEYIKNNFEDKVLNLSGLPSTVAHCAKMLWWKNEQPEIFAKISKFIQPAAFVAGLFAGLSGREAFIDYTYLHFTGLYDASAIEWSSELCKDFGIPMDKLPDIVEPWKVVGTLTEKAARDCGLVPGVAIAAGTGDQAAGFLGAGLVEPGMLVDVAGTASVFACCVNEYKPDLKFKTLLFPKAASKGLWFPHAYIGGGGLCLRWFRDGIVKPGKDEFDEIYKILDREASELPAGSDSLMFIPHLGGRNYPYDSDVRGIWAGFSWGHERKHFYRAMMEAVAYEYYYYLKIEKDLFPNANFKEVRAIGGGSKSRVFNQIKANVLGIPYVQLSRDEVGGLGSAIIAGHAVGLISNMEEAAKRFVSTKNRIEPDMKANEYYKNFAELYIEMFRTLKPLYNRLAEISAIEKP
ncbi:MAG: FGGY family carbohydrate kinase [Clostridia bacterium]|nr:FGGY family carbohydrate kinase [Clostridia bacterium]